MEPDRGDVLTSKCAIVSVLIRAGRSVPDGFGDEVSTYWEYWSWLSNVGMFLGDGSLIEDLHYNS